MVGDLPGSVNGTDDVNPQRARPLVIAGFTPCRQSSGRAVKSRLACLYHPIPEMGCFHRPFISLEAGWCSSSPPFAISLRCRSWAFMTSSAVAPPDGQVAGTAQLLACHRLHVSLPFS